MVKTLLLLMIVMCGLQACRGLTSDKSDPAGSFMSNDIDYKKAASANVELAINYLNQDQIVRAKSKIIKAKKLAPQLPEVHVAYALYLEKVGENLLAEESYRKALRLHPKSGNAHYHYGTYLYRQHQYKMAEKEFLKALSDPDYLNMAQALENAALCSLENHDKEKANHYFAKAKKYYSSSSKV